MFGYITYYKAFIVLIDDNIYIETTINIQSVFMEFSGIFANLVDLDGSVYCHIVLYNTQMQGTENDFTPRSNIKNT